MLLRRAFPVLALVVGLVVLPAAAHADGGRLELSPDGRTWASSLDAPVLDADGLVPGETVTGRFHLRNASDDDALLRAQGLADGDALALEAAGLFAQVRFEDGVWQSLDGSGLVVPAGGRTAAGTSVTADLRVGLRATAGRAATARHAAYRIRLTLTQAAGHGTGPGTGNGPSGGGLPGTGAPDLTLPLLGAAALLGAGLALLLGARRRRDDSEGRRP